MFRCFAGCFCCSSAAPRNSHERWDAGTVRSTALIGKCCSATFAEEYELIGREIGSGVSGPVVLAKPRYHCAMDANIQNGVVAVKRIQTSGLTDDVVHSLLEEVEIYAKMDHKNVARLLQVFRDDSDVILVMEYCSGGSLAQRLLAKGKFSDVESAGLMRQILAAVYYCHSHTAGREGGCIVHCDLKHANFVFSGDNLKLVDFGLATVLSEKQPTARATAGTLYYMAPEVVERKAYEKSCDMWSVGVIAYYLLSGQAPFFQSSIAGTAKDICAGRYRAMDGDRWNGMCPGAKDFIERCLQVDPSQRLTAKDALQHEWLRTFESKPKLSTRKTLEDLALFTKGNALQRAAAAYLTYKRGPEQSELLDTVTQQFEALDTDGDGRISLCELDQALSSELQCSSSVSAKDLLGGLDVTQNGHVEYSEFLAGVMGNKSLECQDTNRAIFDRFDLDGDGKLQVEELKIALGETFCGQTAHDILREVDKNNDGAVDYDEFSRSILAKDES